MVSMGRPDTGQRTMEGARDLPADPLQAPLTERRGTSGRRTSALSKVETDSALGRLRTKDVRRAMSPFDAPRASVTAQEPRTSPVGRPESSHTDAACLLGLVVEAAPVDQHLSGDDPGVGAHWSVVSAGCSFAHPAETRSASQHVRLSHFAMVRSVAPVGRSRKSWSESAQSATLPDHITAGRWRRSDMKYNLICRSKASQSGPHIRGTTFEFLSQLEGRADAFDE